MKRIPKEFTKVGYTYRLLNRVEEYAIYERSSPIGCKSYEVIKIRKRTYTPRKLNDGRVLDYGTIEIYPCNEEFGKYGWSYSNLENGLNKYIDLVK